MSFKFPQNNLLEDAAFRGIGWLSLFAARHPPCLQYRDTSCSLIIQCRKPDGGKRRFVKFNTPALEGEIEMDAGSTRTISCLPSVRALHCH